MGTASSSDFHTTESQRDGGRTEYFYKEIFSVRSLYLCDSVVCFAVGRGGIGRG